MANKRPQVRPAPAPRPDKIEHSTRVRARARRPAKDSAAAGAATEAKILRVLADPQHLHKSTTAKIKLAGVSRSTWYAHLNDPLFRARVTAACRRALDDHLGPILNALVESAQIVGKEGHPDRKLFLELQGSVQPGASVEVSEEMKKPAAVMSDQELLEAFVGREHLLPAGVLRRLGRDPDSGLDKPNQPKEAKDGNRKRAGQAPA